MNYIKSVKQFLWPELLITNESALWIIDCYRWALDNFDSDEFYQRTALIQPNNRFFPGDVSSVEEKAQNIFKHSLKYAGLEHWPIRLQHTNLQNQQRLEPFGLEKIQRNSQTLSEIINGPHTIDISYNRQLTLKPEDLASHFSHMFAMHLLKEAGQSPPGGIDYAVEASEVLAVFMGFGILFSNSAYTFRGGCGSCYNASANRQASLSESEILFALAVFCHLKKIDTKSAAQGLKKHLKSSFTIARRQVEKMLASNQVLALAAAQRCV